jgi:hypothetical protein
LCREEHMDGLRLLTRDRDPKPFIKAMAHIHQWTAGLCPGTRRPKGGGKYGASTCR